jgi:hypothetical protein
MKNVLYLRLKRKKPKSLIEDNQQRRERDREWIRVFEKKTEIRDISKIEKRKRYWNRFVGLNPQKIIHEKCTVF